jgi:hypothetical protein
LTPFPRDTGEDSNMEERGVWIGAIVATAALGAAIYYFYIRDDGQPAPVTASKPVAEQPADEPPPIRNPLPPVADEGPLPPLAESDPAARDSLKKVFGEKAVEELVVPEGIVRRFVITVDNLPRKKVPVQSRPVASAGGSFRVKGTDDDITLDEQNYARYTPVVTLLEKADPQQLAATYRRFYPLFQDAYGDLGREGAYFNDRMVEVIDHLIATPDVPGPIKLVQPRVYYEFADPKLEQLSAGQKLLIRMGPDNAAVVKEKLRQVREQIAAQTGP